MLHQSIDKAWSLHLLHCPMKHQFSEVIAIHRSTTITFQYTKWTPPAPTAVASNAMHLRITRVVGVKSVSARCVVLVRRENWKMLGGATRISKHKVSQTNSWFATVTTALLMTKNDRKTKLIFHYSMNLSSTYHCSCKWVEALLIRKDRDWLCVLCKSLWPLQSIFKKGDVEIINQHRSEAMKINCLHTWTRLNQWKLQMIVIFIVVIVVILVVIVLKSESRTIKRLQSVTFASCRIHKTNDSRNILVLELIIIGLIAR